MALIDCAWSSVRVGAPSLETISVAPVSVWLTVVAVTVLPAGGRTS